MRIKLDRDFYTPNETAKILNASPEWIREIHREGLAKSVEPRRRLLIPQRAVRFMAQYISEPHCFGSPYRTNFGEWLERHHHRRIEVAYAAQTTSVVITGKKQKREHRRSIAEDVSQIESIAREIARREIDKALKQYQPGPRVQIEDKTQPRIVSIERGRIDKAIKKYVLQHLPAGSSDVRVGAEMKKVHGWLETAFFGVTGGMDSDRRESQLRGETFPEWLERNDLLSEYRSILPDLFEWCDRMLYDDMSIQLELGL